MKMRRVAQEHNQALSLHFSVLTAFFQECAGKDLVQVQPGWKHKLVLMLRTGYSTFLLRRTKLYPAAVSNGHLSVLAFTFLLVDSIRCATEAEVAGGEQIIDHTQGFLPGERAPLLQMLSATPALLPLKEGKYKKGFPRNSRKIFLN